MTLPHTTITLKFYHVIKIKECDWIMLVADAFCRLVSNCFVKRKQEILLPPLISELIFPSALEGKGKYWGQPYTFLYIDSLCIFSGNILCNIEAKN